MLAVRFVIHTGDLTPAFFVCFSAKIQGPANEGQKW
jgi:hypothetical protein